MRGGEIAVFVVIEYVEMKAAVSCKRLLSATKLRNQELVVGVTVLHSSMLLGGSLPPPCS